MIKKCSIDFDDTLSGKYVQKYVKELISKGIEVWLCTTRYDNKNVKKHYAKKYINVNDELYKICKEVGISKDKILFTNMIWKSEFFNTNDYDFLFHLDNSKEELKLATIFSCKIPFINCTVKGWKKECNKLLK